VVWRIKDLDPYFWLYRGGQSTQFYDELQNFKSDKPVLVRHEQRAGHAAEGYARSSGKPGVILVTSGTRRNKCSYSFD
jgi:Thiamine pyrophosphate-requiring enzymes [acetolactate synthase, pyruvate dehydrogenase (cytochrome), glyoxylate carboligase, phosphonopyruvate decarboxylase]